VADVGDWRLMGQDRYLQGATLIFRKWTLDRPDWDHDHCAFCTVHIGDHVFEDDTDTQLEGWVTEDGMHWICNQCFEDFRQRFEWVVATPE